MKVKKVRSRPASGLGFCKSMTRRIDARSRAGKRTCVVFDIDNTLVDTRGRTVAAGKSFARQNRSLASLALKGITRSQAGYDGIQTIRRLGMPSPLGRTFQSHWLSFFWSPNNFKHDAPIRKTIQIARQAKLAGAEVYYLTGRVEGLKGGTIDQLKRLGLPDADGAHVICKPGVGVRTGPFKQQVLSKMLERGKHIAWFMSDSPGDIAAVQQKTSVSCVMVDFPVNAAAAHPRIDAETPVIRIR